MSTWGDSSLLVELVERQFNYVLFLKGTNLLVRLPRLLDFLTREPRIAALLQDAESEAAVSLQRFERRDQVVREQLESIWGKHSSMIAAAVATQSEPGFRVHEGPLEFSARLRGAPSVVEFPRPNSSCPRSDETATLVRMMQAWWTGIAAMSPRPLDDEDISKTRGALSVLWEVQKHNADVLRIDSRSLLWPAYARLRESARLLDVEPPTSSSLTEWARFEKDRDFATTLHLADEGEVGLVEEHDVDAVYSSIPADALLLQEELVHRVGVGRSRRGVVLRFAARCEWFEAAKLRELCAAAPGRAEQILTLRLAEYVFDQGFSPLLDPTIGGLRPDVLGLSFGDPLYIEAKQYDAEYPKAPLVAAYAQVWDTWAKLRKHHHIREAFIVVFRRGGPSVELPPVIQYDDMRLYSVTADISEEAGSRNKSKVLRIAEEDLRPKETSDS